MKYLLPTVISLYIFSLLGELGSYWWVFDLFSHWRTLYLVAGLILVALAVIFKNRKWAFTAATVLVCHIIVVAASVAIFPQHAAGTQQHTQVTAQAQEASLRVAFANTYWRNPDMAQVAQAVYEMNPDIVFMEELQPEQFVEIQALLPEYTYALHAPVDYAFDMGVFSKLPVQSEKIHFFMPEVPLIEIVIQKNGKNVHLLGVHPHSPVSAQFSKDRNSYLQDLFHYVNNSQDTMIMGGDFNISQFSPILRDLVKDSRLVDTQKDFPLTGTWPTQLPTWAAIPIDQVFVTPDVQVENRYRGTFTGSDHWPIVVEVRL